ncbi:YetF domain-containing protein [Peribacillus deserti]|uniref:DUF421 domain-containing protein n=1 Tax=Peribacillus deserti TaxID=673318 RepID=A0A2N5MA57_9BACI|nr:DUF421 domain-containing protein [Peribacillus deserti]PLT31248.1 hypothetical protein CUU66_03465 [Peribacillus deserti]
MGYLEAVFRVVCSFLVLMVLTRMMGKKEISQLNIYTFVTAITIGNIAASLSSNENIEIDKGIFVLIGWAILTILIGFISAKSKRARQVIVGEASIIIHQGRIMEQALQKTGLDMDTLEGMLREQKVFSLSEVEYAILEIDGKLSVKTKEDKKRSPNTRKKNPMFPIPVGVIYEGEIDEPSLEHHNLTSKWLMEQLKRAGVLNIGNIFYAEIQSDGSLYIDYKEDHSLR